MIAVILMFMRGMKLVQKTNLKELKAIMEVLLATVRCSIQVYIGYLRSNKSFYMKLVALLK